MNDEFDELDIGELKPDPENARIHTPRNLNMITDSLQEVGAARSIVIDENNVVLAGNGVLASAARAGIGRVVVVDASGNEIVAVRRKNLTEQKKKMLALYDNRTAELGEWDREILQQMREQMDFGKLWTEAEQVDMGVIEQPPAPPIKESVEITTLLFESEDDKAVAQKWLNNIWKKYNTEYLGSALYLYLMEQE